MNRFTQIKHKEVKKKTRELNADILGFHVSGDIPKRGYSQWEMPCYNAQMQLSSCLLLFKQNFTHNEIKFSKLSRIFLETL